VPDEAVDATGPDGAVDVRWGADTDRDGRPDTLLTADGVDLLVLSDLDGDGLADRVLRIGPDAAVHVGDAPQPELAHPDVPHGHPVGPPAPAPARGVWEVLLGSLSRPDT
jgi:hypothetical protein